MTRIVLAYSGDLSSSVALLWLRQAYDAEVVTITVDVGQPSDLAVVRERALALGAIRAHVIDAREQFAHEFLLPALQAGAFSPDAQPSVPLARTVLAARLVDLARMESARVVAHGGVAGSATGPLLAAVIGSLDPSLDVIPVAEAARLSADDMIAFAREAGIPVPVQDGPWIDADLWSRTIGRSGAEPEEDLYLLTRSIDQAPESAATLELEFAAGVPVRTNGVEMPLLELIESVETIAGAHGVGRMHGAAGERVVEAPAAAVLTSAHAALEAASVGPELAELKRQISAAYRAHLAAGRWFEEVTRGMDAFTRILQQRVNGTVRLRLARGRCELTGPPAPAAASASKAVA